MRLYFWKLTSRVPGPKNCVNCASTHTHHRIVPCISKILLCENNDQAYIIKKNFIYLNERVQSQVTDWNLPSSDLQSTVWVWRLLGEKFGQKSQIYNNQNAHQMLGRWGVNWGDYFT